MRIERLPIKVRRLLMLTACHPKFVAGMQRSCERLLKHVYWQTVKNTEHKCQEPYLLPTLTFAICRPTRRSSGPPSAAAEL
jgi:hypothetical protein